MTSARAESKNIHRTKKESQRYLLLRLYAKNYLARHELKKKNAFPRKTHDFFYNLRKIEKKKKILRRFITRLISSELDINSTYEFIGKWRKEKQ